MPLSANTLFHFTRDFDTLLRILETKFYPRMCLEQPIMPQLPLRLAVSMVCFCDIPLSQISEHVSKYGRYAIGVKKAWAVQQGVTPVLYVHENSLIPRTILQEMTEIARNGQNGQAAQLQRMTRYVDTVCMMKPYSGYDERAGHEVRYYDEREWRYVPQRQTSGQFRYLLEDLFKQDAVRQKIDAENEQFGLNFTPDVINYLIVDREDEILTLKQRIEKIKGDFPHRSVELLSTRILSMERIQEDV